MGNSVVTRFGPSCQSLLRARAGFVVGVESSLAFKKANSVVFLVNMVVVIPL